MKKKKTCAKNTYISIQSTLSGRSINRLVCKAFIHSAGKLLERPVKTLFYFPRIEVNSTKLHKILFLSQRLIFTFQGWYFGLKYYQISIYVLQTNLQKYLLAGYIKIILELDTTRYISFKEYSKVYILELRCQVREKVIDSK